MSGRIKLLFSIIAAVALVVAIGVSGYYAYDSFFKPEKVKPHIIIITADNLGYNDIGYNNPSVITPNLDKLAANGLILDQSYTQAICSPSRAALLTGKYPYKIGMQHGTLLPGMPHCSPTNVPFLSERLQQAGYQTHLMGKWHLGACKSECLPNSRGFDSFEGLLHGQGDHFTQRTGAGYDWYRDTTLDTSSDKGYTTHLIKNRTISIITDYEEGDKPMFLWVSFSAPHTPLQAPQEYKDLYPNISEPRKTYLAMISALDEGVGDIVGKLKEKDLLSKTILIFSSDGGGANDGASSNYPLRGGAAGLFEGGSRAPAFVSGPLVTKKGRSNGLFHITDWLPTILNMVDSKLDDDEFTIDGIDQRDMLLEGGASKRREIVYNIDIDWSSIFFAGNAAVRQGDWKLIWGVPGSEDGYTPNLEIIYHMNFYLSFINKTFEEYTDIPKRRPIAIWTSPQETENRNNLGRIIGIYNITEQDMMAGKGLTMLFNLKDDPEERNDLSQKDELQDKILKLKELIMSLIKNGYVSKLENIRRYKPGQSIENGVWSTNYCQGVDTNIP